MATGRARWTWVVSLATALATISGALAQNQPGEARKVDSSKARAGGKTKRKGGLFAGGAAPPKGLLRKDDPLAVPQAAAKGDVRKAAAEPPKWPYHVTFKLVGDDGVALSAEYYPSRSQVSAPVLMLLHQGGAGHSGQDFTEPIEELKGKGMAQRFQDLDYAVLVVDRRGHGAGRAQQVVAGTNSAATLARDIQTAYTFLIDRHNRQELNLAHLGVIAVGDAANLACLWAAESGAVSSPGRLSDIGELILVCPNAEAFGFRLTKVLPGLAPRVPIVLIAGERDSAIFNDVRPIVERNRQSKGALFATRLQGDRLLRFEPKALELIVKSLEEPVKFRPNADWEPRYLLNPVVTSSVTIVNVKADATEPAKKDAAKKDEPAKKDAAKRTSQPRRMPRKRTSQPRRMP